MLDERRGDEIRVVRGVVVGHEDAGELALVDDGEREAAVAALELHRHAVDQKCAVHGIGEVFRRGERAVRLQQATVAFELPDGERVPETALRDGELRDAFHELRVVRLEQREVRLVVHKLYRRGHLAPALCGLKFYERSVPREVAGDEHFPAFQHGPDGALRLRLFLPPRAEEVPRLAGDIHAHDAEFFLCVE